MGDFNIHVDNFKDENSIKFLEMIEVMGLQQNVKTPTQRWSYSGSNSLGDEQQS